MNLESLSYQCEKCADWHTKAQCKTSLHGMSTNGYAIEKLWCECGGEVFDADETGTVTPYGELRLELLREQRDAYLELAQGIDRQMTDIDGKRRV